MVPLVVRRYVQATQASGVAREGGDGQLSDEVLGAVLAVVRPDRPRGTGASWEAIVRRHGAERVEDACGRALEA